MTLELITVGDVEIATRVRGEGPPLLLLHGYPQTQRVWNHVAASLADAFTVVTTDLRGYGRSSKPPAQPDHRTYSKRALADDQVAVMDALGFERFAVAGHDRGGRVVQRMCLDHPARVTSAAVIDIIPGTDMYTRMDSRLASAYFHWPFLSQQADLPERLLASEPDRWMDRILGRDSGRCSMSLEAIEEYKAAFRDPATIHATCEDYRAGASIDLADDAEDLEAGNRIDVPLLVLWGAAGLMSSLDALACWQQLATDVTGFSLPGGHFLIDDSPAEVTSALRDFFLDHHTR